MVTETDEILYFLIQRSGEKIEIRDCSKDYQEYQILSHCRHQVPKEYDRKFARVAAFSRR